MQSTEGRLGLGLGLVTLDQQSSYIGVSGHYNEKNTIIFQTLFRETQQSSYIIEISDQDTKSARLNRSV